MSADLIPETKSRVGVQFTQFKIFGLLPVTAPASAKGQLDTTFVDEELRISRGDKGATLSTHDAVHTCHVCMSSRLTAVLTVTPVSHTSQSQLNHVICYHAGNLFVLTMEDPSGKP